MMDDSAARTLFPATALEGVSLGGAEVAAARGYVAPAEEAALVASARSGDQDSFGALVCMHQRQVYNLTLRMLRDTEEASEATQDVFLAAWQGLRQFRGDARFTTWLYRIATTTACRCWTSPGPKPPRRPSLSRNPPTSQRRPGPLP